MTHSFFTRQLLEWYEPDARPMPWKGEKDPYLIWLSEIMLQQTRVEQGKSYFLKFKEKYPTVADLANASEDELMKDWEGLGYYSRARNLHFTAKFIHSELDGVFPNTYEDIIALKGVGAYTAAAIASFGYQLPYAVIDGNVYRIFARFFGIHTPTDSTEGKKEIGKIAQQLLDTTAPHIYNQAIMDFGATVCKPKGATCGVCPLQEECMAFKRDEVYELPVKTKKIKKKTRYFNYLIIEKGDRHFIRKRVEKDIWKDLYEFPLIESDKRYMEQELMSDKRYLSIFSDLKYGISKVSDSYKQQLTHQTIYAQFFTIKVNTDFEATNEDWLWIKKSEIRTFAFPKIIDIFLTSKEKLSLF